MNKRSTISLRCLVSIASLSVITISNAQAYTFCHTGVDDAAYCASHFNGNNFSTFSGPDSQSYNWSLHTVDNTLYCQAFGGISGKSNTCSTVYKCAIGADCANPNNWDFLSQGRDLGGKSLFQWASEGLNKYVLGF